MKAAVFTLFIQLALYSTEVYSQTQRDTCNQAVDLEVYKKSLIKEVCIPKGFVITQIYTRLRNIDIDGDGLGDFIFDFHTPRLQDGDTIYITAYRMNTDSTYSFLKTFDHLLPVYFDSYDYGPKKPALKKIFQCYNSNYPLYNLDFEAGVISFDLNIDPASGYTLKYRYDPKRNNWFLFSYREWIDMPDEGREYTDKELPEQPESIDEFSYQKYLCPELYPEK